MLKVLVWCAVLGPVLVLSMCAPGSPDEVCHSDDEANLLQTKSTPKKGSGENKPRSRPVAWAMSGGGWRAMHSAAGFARAFHKAGLLTDNRLTDLACSGGGCWFLAQLSYDKAFFDAVTGLQDIVFKAVVTLKANAYAGSISDTSCSNAVVSFFDLMRTYHSSVSGYSFMIDEAMDVAKAVCGTGYLWRDLVESMLKTDSDANWDDIKADGSSRIGLMKPTLHFQTANSTAASLVNGGTTPWNAYRVTNGNQFISDLPATPMQWVIPGTIAGGNLGWVGASGGIFAKYTLPKMGYTRRRRAFSIPGSSSDYLPEAGLSSYKVVPPLFGAKAPQVVDVASVSSAAGGMFGNPLMVRAFVEYFFPESASARSSIYLAVPAELRGLSVCGVPKDQMRDGVYCDYPAPKLMDGLFVDNMGVAQTVSQMQASEGAGNPLALVLTYIFYKDTPHVTSSDVLTTIPSVAHLFDWDRVSVAPGEIMTPATSDAYGAVRASPAVFSANIADVVATCDPGLDQFEGDTYLGICQVETTTAENPSYGVVAGTPVKLMIFLHGSKLTAWQGGSAQGYVDLATGASDNEKVIQAVTDWLASF